MLPPLSLALSLRAQPQTDLWGALRATSLALGLIQSGRSYYTGRVIGFVSIMVTHSVQHDTLQNGHAQPLGNKYLPLFGQCHFTCCTVAEQRLTALVVLALALVASLNYFPIKPCIAFHLVARSCPLH